MSLRIKIFIGLVSVAFVLMAITGTTSYSRARYEISRQTIEHLQGVADSKERRLAEVIGQYVTEAKSIMTRDDLRRSLLGGQIDQESLIRTLSEVKSSHSSVQIASIFSNAGELIASTNPQDVPSAELENELLGIKNPLFQDAYYDQYGILRARALAPIVTDDGWEFVLELILDAKNILQIGEDRAGLSDTGEVFFVKHGENGRLHFLTPLLYSVGLSFEQTPPREKRNIPTFISLVGEERVLTGSNIRDYRGEPVFAVTRFIEGLEWGLVVKVDQQEALSIQRKLLFTYISILSLSTLLVVLIAFIIARFITHPLDALLKAVGHLKDGNFDMPAEVNTEDEFGRLADSFNKMAKKIKKSHQELEERVEKKTHELAQQLEYTESAKKRAVELLEDVKYQKVKVANEKAKVEAILGSIGSGLIAVDNDRRIILMNEAAEELLGHRERSTIGEVWPAKADVVDEDGNPIPLRKLPTTITLQSGKKCINSNCRLIRKDGSGFDASITSTPITYQGEIIGAVTMFRDITQEKEVDRAKTEFVSLASHQLRTPLASVNWYTEMLLDGDAGELTEDQHTYITEIFKWNKRMIDLVADLLNVSRLDLGTFTIKSEQTRPLEIAQSVVKELELFIREKDVVVREIYSKDISDFQGDENLIRILFLNLLSNAVRYSPKSGVVDAELTTLKKGDTFGGRQLSSDSLAFSVKDEGIGIPLHQQDKIFKKLYRADNAKALEANGTGLGLYIVKSIVEQSGGEIWFDSKPGKWATFYLVLPLTGMRATKVPPDLLS